MCNPFDKSLEDMINIANGAVASPEIQQEMLHSKELGENKCVSFIKERLLTDNPDIFSPIQASKLKTFTIRKPSTRVKTTKGKIVELKSDIKFMTRLLAVGRSREVDMEEIMSYSLRKHPLPFATIDGELIKTPKSKLLHLIESLVDNTLVENLPAGNALMLDGMVVIQTLKNIPETFGALAESILHAVVSSVCSSRSKRVDFVCDTYPDISIKNLERNNRALGLGGSTVVKILGPNQKVPRQFKKILSVGKNKEALIEFFFDYVTKLEHLPTAMNEVSFYIAHGKVCHNINLNELGFLESSEIEELYTDHEEADTRLVLHANHAAIHHRHVVVRSPDTDVFILLISLKSSIPSSLMFDTGTQNHRRVISIDNVVDGLGPSLSEALIGFHAFTGKLR